MASGRIRATSTKTCLPWPHPLHRRFRARRAPRGRRGRASATAPPSPPRPSAPCSVRLPLRSTPLFRLGRFLAGTRPCCRARAAGRHRRAGRRPLRRHCLRSHGPAMARLCATNGRLTFPPPARSDARRFVGNSRGLPPETRVVARPLPHANGARCARHGRMERHGAASCVIIHGSRPSRLGSPPPSRSVVILAASRAVVARAARALHAPAAAFQRSGKTCRPVSIFVNIVARRRSGDWACCIMLSTVLQRQRERRHHRAGHRRHRRLARLSGHPVQPDRRVAGLRLHAHRQARSTTSMVGSVVGRGAATSRGATPPFKQQLPARRSSYPTPSSTRRPSCSCRLLTRRVCRWW